MTSANGYLLNVDGYVLRASWPAPFYALICSQGPEGPDAPMLIHCETLEDARRKGGETLDHAFQPVT